MVSLHILIVSPRTVLRDALQSYLRREGAPLWIVDACDDFSQAHNAHAKPDLVLVHHTLVQEENTPPLFASLCARHPVVIMGERLSAENAHSALQLGAAGYVAKNMTGRDFLAALEPFMSKKPARVYTPRESEVHDLLQKGLANKEIASALDIAVVTVKLHVRNILRKAGCTSRARLLAQRG